MKTSLLRLLIVPALLSFAPLGLWAADADNSTNNVADRRADAVTPESQSNKKEDVEVTRAIRRAVVKDSSLSVYAHNIKIITTANHIVFLRGSVSSSDDVGKIVALAEKNSAGYPVKNQISVSFK